MEQLRPLIDQLVKMIQSGVDVVNDQLPEVAKQILVYNAWNCRMWMNLMVGLLIFGILLFFIGCLVRDLQPLAVFGVIFSVSAVILYFDNYSEVKKIQLAPKVYMIEQLTKMVK